MNIFSHIFNVSIQRKHFDSLILFMRTKIRIKVMEKSFYKVILQFWFCLEQERNRKR